MLVLLEPYIGIGERLTAALREASSQLTVLTPQPHMAGSDVLGENIAFFSTKRLENQTKSPTFESHVRKLSLFSDSEPWECQRILGRKCKLTSLLPTPSTEAFCFTLRFNSKAPIDYGLAHSLMMGCRELRGRSQ